MGKTIVDDGSVQSNQLKDQLIQMQLYPLLVAFGIKNQKIWKYLDDLNNFNFND